MKTFHEIYREKKNTTPIKCESDAEKIFDDVVEEYLIQLFNEKFNH